MKEFKNLCKCKQAHEYAQIKCTQSSSWACSPYLCASLVQEFWSSSILQYCSLLTMCGHLYVISFVLSDSTSMRWWCGFYEYYVSYNNIISFRINQVCDGDFVSQTSQTWTWWIWWFLISFPMPEQMRMRKICTSFFSLGLAWKFPHQMLKFFSKFGPEVF